MSHALSAAEVLDQLAPAPRFAVLMCGVAGSGKTTFSQQLEAKGFARVSMDEILWNVAGRYGIDYPPEAYGEKLIAAREAQKLEVERRLADGQAIVVDSAFWSRAHRQAYVALVAAAGGRSQIVYLKAGKATLQARLDHRRPRFDANAALPIDDARLDQFIASFEEPTPDEHALVVAVGG